MKHMQVFLNQANILIVGGHSSNLEILIKILSCKKYNIKNVLNDKLVLQFEPENQPDIILVEISNMSNMDGFEVCKTFKNNHCIKEIPIILINTYNENINIDKGKVFDVGGADYLTVPFNEQEVLTRIETHLKLRFMELEMKKFSSNNEGLMKANSDLEYMINDKTQQLKDITMELKEFNVMLAEEISERTKTEESLKDSERRFRYAIEEAPLPIMLYTENGEVKNINRTWTNITGYKLSDMPTISDWAKMSDLFVEQLDDGVNRVFDAEGRSGEGEYTIRTITGEKRVWHFYSAHIGTMQDSRRQLIRVAIDITERKNMDKLQKIVEEEQKKIYEIKEYDRIKTEFFSNISHELRTPINVIFSALQVHELKLKNNQSLYTNASKYIGIMKQNCHRLLRLINNLIDITKIDSGYFDIDENNFDIVNIVENITLSVADYIENKGLTLIFDTFVEEKIIACDPEKIERIMLNLLSNAVKFTPVGGEILVAIKEWNDDNICISVKDTGKGIPKDKLNSIFERFVQVDKSLTRDNEGSGIGLSLVKLLVELHNGRISVQSREGEGSEFIICLPCKLVDRANYEVTSCDSRGENIIEKISLEFADIYK